jgi:hypothetical protein
LKLGGFRGGNPGEVETPRFDAHVFQQSFEQGKFPSGVIISGDVMTVSGMASGYPDPIRPAKKSA